MSETKVQANSQGKLYISNGRLLSCSSGGSSGVIDSLNVTPTTSAQTITASGGVDGYSPVYVSPVTSSIDSNITAENIKDGVTILGVTGNHQGGDTIFLPNESGATINAGDKVLFTLGTNRSANDDSFTVTYKNNSVLKPVCIFDNNSFLIAGYDSTYNGYLFTKINGTWTKGSMSNIYGTSSLGGAGSGVYHYFDNGYINSYDQQGGKSSFFVTAGGATQVAGDRSRSYMGDYNGSSYVARNSSGATSINKWNKTDNTLTQVLSVSSFNPDYGYQRIFGDRMLITNAASYKLYQLSDDVTFTLLSNGALGSETRTLGATGLATGDVVFVVSNWYYNYSSYQMQPTSCLFCYKVQSDGSITYYEEPQLKMFENTPCSVSYDNRSNILSIGTKDEVYFYEFDTTNKTFTRISVFHTTLPTPYSDIPLKVAMTPDKSTFVVYGWSSTANAVYVYTNQESYQRIVPNSQYYYDLTTSFTGIATGETDEDDNYEISTVLPPIVESKIITDLEPDEVIIKGGAE